MTITAFCDKHIACAAGRKWALATGEPDMDALWKRTDIKPEWRVWIATQHGVLDDRTMRLFACWCVRQVWHMLTDDRSRNAVEVAEQYADGKATEEDLAAAREAAGEAAWAAREAAREAAGEAQSEYLLQHTTPNFDAAKGE